MSFFADYYNNTITKPRGFKLVLGGTGLGKTRGIIETLPQHPEENKRFFYFANRLQLLDELENDLKKANIGYSRQRRDDEILNDISEANFRELTEKSLIIKYARKVSKNENALETALKMFKFLKSAHSLKGTDYGEEILRERTSRIFYLFKSILRKSTENNRDYEGIKAFPTIKAMFPYIDFQDNPAEKRIFLVSLQKAFYGFFDGKRVINLFKLKSNEDEEQQNIIFLDEFDFLENDLLAQICKDVNVEEPFSFVESFYHVLKKYKLPRSKFLENHESLRTKIQTQVIDEVDSLSSKYKIPFPEINHFLCTEKKLKNISIFQTRYSISTKPIHLNYNKKNDKDEPINSFYLEIADENNNKPANSYALLNVVNQATSAIIRIIKDLEFSEPAVADALIEHCFRTSDKYKRILKIIRQHPAPRRLVPTNISKVYYNGFGLYEIHDFKFPTDIDEVELKYYSIFSTPEIILLNLTKNNLVFGLSATAEIDRFVKSFDLGWLKGELGDALYHDITEDDTKVIEEANNTKFAGSEKNEGRNNEVSVEIANLGISPKLYKVVDNEANSNEEVFGEGSQKDFRVKRVHLFFSTLNWITNENRKSSNLLFYTSYSSILHFFQKVPEPENGAYTIRKMDNKLKNCYTINFEQNEFIVLFLNAAQGKEITRFEQDKADYYALFRKGLPVVLVTMYASAGNGVNLFYYADEECTQRRDYDNIHLLDSPFYFFSPINNDDTEQERREKINSNIYHLTKLEKNKIITEKQFKIYLNNIRNITKVNEIYHNTPDALYNKVAAYIQAIGRIERSWDKVNDQVIRLEHDVYNNLEDFCKIDDGDYKRYRRKYLKNLPYYSRNVARMFDQILEKETERKIKISHYQEEHLQAINEKCRSSLKSLVSKLQLVRENQRPPKILNNIRKEWQQLRQIALQHDFASQEARQLLKKHHCIFDTEYYNHQDKTLYIQAETLNIAPKSIHPDSSFYAWKPGSIYNKVISNPILAGHFDYSRYEMGFVNDTTFYTPYFYQCILAGAIGEEAVKAVFKREGILLNEGEIDNSLFELIDLKIAGKPWYIDAKNYSEKTVRHFEITDEDDPLYHPKLNSNHFKESAINKLNKIKGFHNNESADVKIIYANVFGDSDRSTTFFDEAFNTVGSDFEKAKIIVVSSMLNDNYDKEQPYSKGFSHLLSQINKK